MSGSIRPPITFPIGAKVRITKGLLTGIDGEITNHGEGWSKENGYYVIYAVQVGGRRGTMFSMSESQLEMIENKTP